MHKLFLVLYYLVGYWLPGRNSYNSYDVRIRYQLCRFIFRSIGISVNIQPKVYFGSGQNISIGDYSGIGAKSQIGNSRESVVIGKNVLCGPELIIYTDSHNFLNKELLIREQGGFSKPVLIGDDVWIGSRVTIMPGVTIHDGVVVGAGAVVTRDVPQYAVVAGVPARILKYRI
jgi:maltose O-acetyltransferase